MAAIDDLTELVERAAAAEKSALASKWKDESDVQSLIRRTRKAAEEQRQAVRLDTDPHRLSPRWASLQQNYLDLGAQPALPGQELSAQERPDDGDADGVGDGAHSAVESSGRGAGGIGRGGRGRGGPDGPDRRRAGRVAGQVGPDPGGRGPVGRGGGRRSRAAARSQRGQPARPGARPRRLRGDQVRAHPEAAEHGEVSGDRSGPRPALPGLPAGVQVGPEPAVAALPGAVGDLVCHGWSGLHQRDELRRDAGAGRAGHRCPAVAAAGDQEPGVVVHRRAARFPAQRPAGLASG